MPRTPQQITPTERQMNLVILATSSGAAQYVNYNFLNGSINYLGNPITQSFQYVTIDNIGEGIIRVTYNRPDYEIRTLTNGAKTMIGGSSFFIDDDVWCIRIYFVEASVVEIVMNSDKKNI
jgi:hypothetical protein